MLTCAITGSTGILGKKILKFLPFKFYKFKGDITKINQVKKWVLKKNFDLVIHLAAIVPTSYVKKNYKKAYDVNVTGTLNLINALLEKKIKPKWFFFSSSSHVYKLKKKYIKINEKAKIAPQNAYGNTKVLAEKILKRKLKNKINLCIGRIFSFTDKNQKSPFVIPSIKKKIKSCNKSIELTDLNHCRDFISTKQIAFIINKLRIVNAEGIYNIGNGQAINLMQIAKIFAYKYKKNINFKFLKKTTYLIANNKKIRTKINWKPKKYLNNLKYLY